MIQGMSNGSGPVVLPAMRTEASLARVRNGIHAVVHEPVCPTIADSRAAPSDGRATPGRTVAVGVVPRRGGPASATEVPGDVVLLSGAIGVHGAAVMSKRENPRFETETESDCAPLGGPGFGAPGWWTRRWASSRPGSADADRGTGE